MARRSAAINVMVKAAYKAARGLVRDFGEVENLQVSQKGPADFVSAADLRAEGILRYELARARPGCGFLLEEGGVVEGTDPTRRWVVDPLDGTLNFLHGIPHFCISIGFQHEDEVTAGVIYDPLRDELFYAEKGQGAFLNNHRLRVSSRSRLDEAVIATGISRRNHEKYPEYFRQFAIAKARTADTRQLGSAALDLAYVAAGRVDGFWQPGLSLWDIAAGVLILREAGGLVSEIDGGAKVLKSCNVLAANDRLHEPLIRMLAEAADG